MASLSYSTACLPTESQLAELRQIKKGATWFSAKPVEVYVPAWVKKAEQNLRSVRAKLAHEAARQESAFEKFEAAFAARNLVKSDTAKASKPKPTTAALTSKGFKIPYKSVVRKEWRVSKKNTLGNCGENVITGVLVTEPVKMSLVDIKSGVKRATSVSQRKSKLFKRPSLKSSCIDSLIRALVKIQMKKCKSVEVIGNRALKVNFRKTRFGIRSFVQTHHERGNFKKRDYPTTVNERQSIKDLLRGMKQRCISTAELDKGDSGMVITSGELVGNHSNYIDDLFIVRGSCGTRVYNALLTQNLDVVHSMKHY
nr:P1 [Donkey orchid virus A]